MEGYFARCRGLVAGVESELAGLAVKLADIDDIRAAAAFDRGEIVAFATYCQIRMSFSQSCSPSSVCNQ